MGELIRSQPVSYGQLIVPMSVAEDTIQLIGELNCVQFVDLNSTELTFNRRFCNELKRCDELERKMRYFNEMITKEESREDMGGLKFQRKSEIYDADKESTENLELRLESLEKDLKQIETDCAATENDLEKIEEGLLVSNNIDSLFENMDDVNVGGLKYVIGVIEKSKYDSVQRLIWRISRGLVLIKSKDLSDNSHLRNFLVLFQGDDLEIKINKSCQSLGVRLYTRVPIDQQERRNFVEEALSNKQQLSSVFESSTKQKREMLKKVAIKLEDWKETVTREKLIFFTLNMFKVEKGQTLIGECWYPSARFDDIIQKLGQLDQSNMSPILSPIAPPPRAVIPTYTKNNSFTQTFQDLTDSYGTPRYGEINTAWLNIVTFPWLFGVMFSDAGHGLFIFLLGLAFIIFAKKLQGKEMNDIFVMLFDARYLLLLMGCYAMYCGCVFNEFFGFSIDLFGTGWDVRNEEKKVYERSDSGKIYYFGVDPIWKASNNELYYVNSLKMKLSILIGVFHMIFGIILSVFNYIHAKKLINVWFHWIPEMIFMVCSFGYLCFLIIFKWCAPVQEGAPMLTNVFLEMFQNFGVVTEANKIYSGQAIIEPILLALVVVSILIMFIPKPIILYMRLRKQQKAHIENKPLLNDNPNSTNTVDEVPMVDESVIPQVADESDGLISDGKDMKKEDVEEEDNEEGNSLMEIIIFNSIHGIEFILGCISNTASYLRLWALSLAHAELSSVFLENVFYLLLEMKICVTIFVGFGAWAMITLAILIGMESLSAFLHTLRLHWIEFQNKFYVGDGVAFMPLKLEPRKTFFDKVDYTEQK
ncbi:vacuolar ATP synthase 98 kDa subunit, putative [Entamoeba invadens IP1]|uniref:V-type proton ATPase subunit a n=1 Tax=Entamoeba invadens IP1 TaxID=370355 RepID=A0A0A1TYJ3_ENTIV|nr:vacuolar ATP synthase 98 kDa subunit, putative [Entamoeba invadens IP1]ELP84625.1 vacuolar ATP synthase 98 kDa subunit, putative [Entamoeba invadens IP1]|eukprot:XP_004183971.1 vacuolar ATP synthase 98 kDa subunit, putative [Entamoeba invadens IP1]